MLTMIVGRIGCPSLHPALGDHGFSVAMGGGLDVALNRAIAVRVAEIDYSRSRLEALNGRDYSQGLRIGAGVVLKLGTW